MQDMTGTTLAVGDRCVLLKPKEPAVNGKLVTVRAINGPKERSKRSVFGHDHARVDDGDPSNADLHANGFTVSSWVMASEIRKV